MNKEIDNLKDLLGSENTEDKLLALNMLQSGYFEFNDIKDIVYDYLTNYERLPMITEEDKTIKTFVMDMIITHSEQITKNRREKL